MPMYAQFDRTNFPLIIVSFTGEKESPENFDAYLAGLHANYDREEAFALVFDATQAPTPNPIYQQKQAKWMKQHEALITTYCRGVAYVMPNGLLRGVLKMIFSLQKNPVPFKVMANLEEGRKWAKSLI